MLTRAVPAVLLLVAVMAGCGETESTEPDAAPTSSPSEVAEEEAASTTPSAVGGEEVASEVRGEPGSFRSGGEGAVPIDIEQNGRECVIAEPLFGSCRASSGVGGSFAVTAESTPEAPSEWNIVVRCGLSPALPAATAQGEFQPVSADLGLEPYGDVVGVTLTADVAEAALVYHPEGSDCPVVWGLGEIERFSLLTGGTDALNGDTDPIWFVDAEGTDACAVADGQGGIKVGTKQGDDCT
jgi:hypothetical protein